MVNITIDGKNYSVNEKLSLLETLQSLELEIPTFCRDNRSEEKLGICGKCAQICRNLQCNHALKLKTTDGKIHTWANKADNINSSTCVSCGNCVSFCPTAGLLPKYKHQFRHWETKTVKTTCGYCGVGCQINFEVKDNVIVESHPILVKPNVGLRGYC